jgi:flagellar motor switch protein FliN/FliY
MADEPTTSDANLAGGGVAPSPAAASVASQLPDLEGQAPSRAPGETPIEPMVQNVGAAKIQLPELKGFAAAGVNKQFNLLLDVSVEVAAVVGVRELKLEQVLAIHPGAIIDLDKHAGEPIELYVNGKPIALAEIVVVDGRLGARVVQSLARPDLS